MKRNFTKYTTNNQLLVILIISMGFSSCSMLEKRSLFDGASNKKDPVNVVSKDQYNELLKKYETLVNSKQIKEAKSESIDLNRPEILDALKNMNEPELKETVTVFEKTVTPDNMKMPLRKELSKIQPIYEKILNPEEIENEIEILRKAQEYIAQNKFNKAMENLKLIENSSVRQVTVNSKFLIGEILFMQQEYDLAMQVFEELIGQDAFSGVVLKTLGRLIVCTEKLKLKEKQGRYYSLLHDFFES